MQEASGLDWIKKVAQCFYAIVFLALVALLPVAATSRSSPPPSGRRPESAVIETNKTGYLAGETVTISGAGFAPLESVMLQVKHADGTTENGGGHDAWFINAGADGSFSSTWSINNNDDVGVHYILTAAGSSRSAAEAAFERVASISANPFASPGSTVEINGSGFNPNQRVTIQVNNQDTLTTTSNANGAVTARLKMPESPSLTAFAVRAVESEISLATPQTVINAATVLASPVSSFFQLDGDTTSGLTAGGGHDWDQVYSDFMRYTTNGSGTNAINFYTDPILNDDSLTGGNSKDTSDLNAWTYGLSTPQNKANLEHAIAASYVDPGNGHTYLYVGADRFDNGGSIALGAWFLQSPIIQAGGKFYTANPDGTPNLNSPAHHVNGDLLLVANFSGGGGSGTITAYTWNNGFSATGTTLASNIGTAIVNTVPLDGVSGHPPAVPWPFTSTSSGTASQYVQVGEFFEAGVDLNLLFPNLTNFNFGTFMVETRSSTSTNATLSDFILGHVSTAPDVTVTKTADSSTVNAGNQVGFTVTVANVGVGDVANVILTDPLPSGTSGIVWSIPTGGNPSGNFVLNGTTAGSQSLSLKPGLTLAYASLPISVHIVGTSSSLDGGTQITNTATVSASNESAAFSSNNESRATVNIGKQPTLTITADAVPSTSWNDDFSKVYDGQVYTGFTVRYDGFVNGDDPTKLGGTLSFSGSGPTAVNAGTYTVIPGGQTSNYYDIQYVAGSLTISKAPSVTAVSCPASVTYNGSAQTPCTTTVTGAGGLSQTLTASPTYTANVNVGTASGSASYAGDINHTGSNDSKTFQINKAPVTATAGSGSVTYDGLTKSPAACAVTGAYTGDLTCANSPASVGPAAGTTTITPDVSGTLTNFEITLVNGSFTISKAPSVTAVTCPASVTYNGPAQTPCTATVTGAGGLSQALTPAYTDNVNVGTATASASFAADTNHTDSNDSKTFQINKAPVTATGGSGSATYDGLTKSPAACAVTGAYIGDLTCANNPASVGPGAGTTTITPDVSGTLTNFEITVVNGTFTISKAPSVTAVSCPASVPYNGSAQTPCTATVTGAGGLSQTLTPAYTDNVNVGTATASASFAGDANHTGSSYSGFFQITGKDQIITFRSFIVGATATSGGAVTFSSGDVTICTVVATDPPTNQAGQYTALVTLVGSNTDWTKCKVLADQTGTTNYNAAPEGTAILGNPANQ